MYIYDSRNYISLLAQNLAWGARLIYDSRNYISLLAIAFGEADKLKSTIVEIILAY